MEKSLKVFTKEIKEKIQPQTLHTRPMNHGPWSSFHNHEVYEEEVDDLNPFGMNNNTPPSSLLFNLQMKIPQYDFSNVVEVNTWLNKTKHAFKMQHMYDKVNKPNVALQYSDVATQTFIENA